MKKKDEPKLHTLSLEELRQKLQEVQSELDHASSEHVAGKLKNTASLLIMRKQIARLQTIIREKALSANVQAA